MKTLFDEWLFFTRPQGAMFKFGGLFCIIEFCSGLEKSPFGAKSDLFFGPEKSSKEGLEVATPENLKWKKYIRQSENANGSPLEPLWGSKKLKVSTKRTL